MAKRAIDATDAFPAPETPLFDPSCITDALATFTIPQFPKKIHLPVVYPQDISATIPSSVVGPLLYLPFLHLSLTLKTETTPFTQCFLVPFFNQKTEHPYNRLPPILHPFPGPYTLIDPTTPCPLSYDNILCNRIAVTSFSLSQLPEHRLLYQNISHFTVNEANQLLFLALRTVEANLLALHPANPSSLRFSLADVSAFIVYEPFTRLHTSGDPTTQLVSLTNGAVFR